MEGEILIRMPLQGPITVTAQGKGQAKVEAVARFERIRGRLKGGFRAWYEFQNYDDPIKRNLEIIAKTGREETVV
jgi:hypothetical protein